MASGLCLEEIMFNLGTRSITGLLGAVAILVFTSSASAQQSLSIAGASTVQGTGSATFCVELDSTAPVEGFVLAITYDSAVVTVDSIDRTALTSETEAELFVPEILGNGWTLGVVMDSGPPFDGQTIAAGSGLSLACFTASSLLVFPLGDPDVTTGFGFLDGTLNNPPLDNIIVQAGQSIGAAQGLALNDAPAALTIQGIPPATLSIGDGSAIGSETGCVSIELDNDIGGTQGFVLAISHDADALDLVDINFDGTATEMWLVPGTGALEFQVINIYPNGGTIGAVLDFDPTSGPASPVIPAGQDTLIANYCYTCDNPITYPLDGSDPPPAETTALSFADGTFGNPALDNVIVVGGQSISPLQEDGTFTCEPLGVPVENTKFSCGPRSYENTADPAANPAPAIEGINGSEVEVCFFYCDPDDNIQGVQLAVCYDCNLTMLDFSITDSIFDEVGAEFFSYSIDDDAGDGDGCEFIAGILLDALPPFEDQTVPPTAVPLIIGCGTFYIDEADTCDTDLAIDFCDGVNAAQSLPTKNIAVIDYESIQNFQMDGCVVRVVPDELFQRGDCNSDDKVDLADAATVLGWQFQGEGILCPDACDANDDGKINLADSVLLMNYLFLSGSAPPDPGPLEDGIDPTEDELPLCDSDDTTC
jgi:hypothetical protein